METHFQSVAFHRSPGGSGLPGPAGPPLGPLKAQSIASNFLLLSLPEDRRGRSPGSGSGAGLGAGRRQLAKAAPKVALASGSAPQAGPLTAEGRADCTGPAGSRGARLLGSRGPGAQEPQGQGLLGLTEIPGCAELSRHKGPEICGARRALG